MQNIQTNLLNKKQDHLSSFAQTQQTKTWTISSTRIPYVCLD